MPIDPDGDSERTNSGKLRIVVKAGAPKSLELKKPKESESPKSGKKETEG